MMLVANDIALARMGYCELRRGMGNTHARLPSVSQAVEEYKGESVELNNCWPECTGKSMLNESCSI